MSMLRSVPFVAALLLAGCPPQGDAVGEVGTGATQFEPFTEGGDVTITCGSQGGQHIWASMRVKGMGSWGLDVSVTMTRVDTGAVVCAAALDDVGAAWAGEWFEVSGITCFVDDPVAAEGQVVKVHGEAMDANGRKVTDEHTVTIRMPEGRCGRF